MFFKIVLALLAASLSYSAAQSCDQDLFYWARGDIFDPAVTAVLQSNFDTCVVNMKNSNQKTACIGTCNGYVCLMSCLFQNFEFVSLNFIFNLKLKLY